MNRQSQKKMIIVGMGERAMIYAKEALAHPELFRIVGVVDVRPERVDLAKRTFDIPEENCFSSVEEMVKRPKFADAVINGTMDQQHVETSIPVLKAGYDLLLEKPFAVNQEEADRLLSCAHEAGRKVMICHVLRYAPFYKEMKTLLSNGEIGTVLSIQMAEHVSYFHQSVSYVRGKYASPKLCGSGMLLSKCSHDLDIMAWMLNGIQPEKVSSIGTVSQFKEDMAPEGAGTHCLLDCPVERECIFSAKRLYLEHPQRWANNIWHECGCVGIAEEEKEQVLRKPDNPYSQCVYLRNLQIVDHQSMMVSFANGALGTFSMVGGSSASGRRIHITGTKGEIYGTFEDQRFTVSLIDPREAGGKKEYVVDVSSAQKGNAHGGGDQAIVRDFISILNNEKPSLCCTTLDDSMIGHQLVFMAEKSRERGGAWMEVK